MSLRMLPAGVYRHYKGHLYQVLGYAEDATNTGKGDVYVVYVGLQLDGNPSAMRMRVRRAQEFTAPVVLDGKMVPRFVYVGPSM